MQKIFNLEPGTWYANLIKPSWTPEPSTIGTIWAVLYPMIIIGFIVVAYKTYKRQLPKRILAVYVVNIIANLLFTPIQFGLKNLPLASLDILIVLATVIILIYMLWNRARWIAVLLVPYLIWVGIATILQLSITLSNT